jgi:S-(hydroxymethyl)glutathione dehydrogenase / alcohol dehydrogenase
MTTTARALVARRDHRYGLEDVVLGEPAGDEVLVEIRASGVCHTDLDLLMRGFDHVMGHEGAGVVAACGPAVTDLTPGDPVLLNWAIPCGECFQCRRDQQSLCEVRGRIPDGQRTWQGHPVAASFGIATMATHTLVPRRALVRIGVPIPFTSACILGCGVMTGFGSVTNVAHVEAGSSVVVLGTGGVGLSCIQGALHAGARTIIGVDINPARLELARRFGATHTLLAAHDDAGLLDVARQVRRLLGRGADYAFECTAVPALGAAPLAMVCNGGTAVAVSGIEQVVPVDMRLFEFDKLYVTPLYGRCRPEIDFPLLLGLYADGRLMLDEMVSRTYPLSTAGLDAAFADMRDGRIAKAVLVP